MKVKPKFNHYLYVKLQPCLDDIYFTNLEQDPKEQPEGLMVSIFFQYNSSPSHKIKSNEEKIEASYVLAGDERSHNSI